MTPPVERWRGSLVLAFFTIFYLAFFANSLASGNYIAPSDSLDFGLSAFLSDQTIWTDGMYSGYPIAADPQAMMWYPVFRLFRAAGLGWNLFMIAAYVIASFGAFLLVWRLTPCRVAALFGGLVYGFSGMLLAHISHYNQVHVAAWVPFLLFGMVELWSGRVALGGLIGSAALALMVLAGHPQLMVYAVYLTAAYAAYRLIRTQAETRQRGHLIAASAVAVAGGFGLAAILLVPAQELAALGRRAETGWELFVSRSLPPWQVLTLVLPLSFGGFRTTADTQVAYFGESSPGEMTGYLGLLPLCLAVGGVWWCRRNRAETLFWLGAGLVTLGLALGDATPLASDAFHLPLYGAFRVPARHLFLVTLCAAVAASLVLAEVITDRRWALMRRAVIGTSAVAALAALTFVWRHDDVRRLLTDDRTYRIWAFGLPALLAAALIVAATVAARRPAWTGAAAALVVTVHVAEMAVFHFVYPGYAQEYAGVPTEWVTLHPRMEEVRAALGQTGGRVLAADGSRNWFLRPNLTRAWAVPAASGTGPLGLERYADLLRLGGPGDVSPEIFGGDNRATDLLSVRYALVPEQWPLINEQRLDGRRWERVERLVWDPADPASAYWLVRSRRALPPAWLVPRVVEVELGQVLPTIHAGRFADGRTFAPEEVALVETGAIASLLPDAGAGTACGKVTLTQHEAAARAYLVEAARPCVLVMSVVWHPWWRAAIDGEEIDLVRVDHTLAGVVVPAGTSRLILEIVPSSLHRGMLISAVAGLAWMVALVIAVRGRGSGTRAGGKVCR